MVGDAARASKAMDLRRLAAGLGRSALLVGLLLLALELLFLQPSGGARWRLWLVSGGQVAGAALLATL
ncbi:MAG: hypothetical protein KC503_00550, partial [Myxococcales bacterium]|nr:hypothetical protein [Myxococcales bacterium]